MNLQVPSLKSNSKVYSAAYDLRTQAESTELRRLERRIYKVAVLVAYSPSLLYPSPADAVQLLVERLEILRGFIP